MVESLVALGASIVIYGVVVPVAIALATVASTWLFTNVRYQITIRAYRGGRGRTGQTRSPVKIPYALPVLGSAVGYIGSKNGAFWEWLFRWHPRATGACTLTLGGRHMHVLYDPRAVQALFKAREPIKHTFNVQVLAKGFGIDEAEVMRYYGFDEPASERHGGRTPTADLEHINVQYVIKPDRVNELTRKFVEELRLLLASELPGGGGGQQSVEVGLYAWMRDHLFTASVIALFGQTLLEDYPDLGRDFAYFDQHLLTCFFGIPRWVSPKVYAVRDRLSAKLTEWQERNRERSKGGHIVDPDGDVDWDPVQGSRAERARMRFFEARGLTLRSRALFDLGLLFALNSNTIPTAGWMLMHILDPHGDDDKKTLYPRVMAEIAASKNPDSSFNIATLVTRPLLQSILHEVLRLYNDTTVARDLHKDLTLPIGDPANDEKLLLHKGSMVIAASWIVHRDDEVWSDPPAHVFCADRFLASDPTTGTSVFDPTVGAGSRLFPWGGGKSICPGRTFAKQEILGSVAMMLDRFDIEGLGYLDGDGKESETFPDLLYGYPGPAMVPPGGDLRVRITRR